MKITKVLDCDGMTWLKSELAGPEAWDAHVKVEPLPEPGSHRVRIHGKEVDMYVSAWASVVTLEVEYNVDPPAIAAGDEVEVVR